MARATPRQVAAYRSAVGKSFVKQLEKDITRKIARGMQEFAVRSMNNLADSGPAWTGEFSQSWVFSAKGESSPSITAGGSNTIGKYNKYSAPLVSIERDIKSGKSEFVIANTSEHALIAIDEVESSFYPPESQPYPIKDPADVLVGGGRPQDDIVLRWQMKEIDLSDPDEKILSRITAPKDWFTTYIKGGALQLDLASGFSVGFESN